MACQSSSSNSQCNDVALIASQNLRVGPVTEDATHMGIGGGSLALDLT